MKKFGMLLGLVCAVMVPTLAAAQGPRADKCSGIESRVVKLDAKNDEWVSADLKFKPDDLIIVMVRGEIVVGQHHGKVDASGSRGDGYGKVEMKVGPGTVIATGTRYTAGVSEGGTVKFRVWDTDYRDNSGSFNVFVVVIPSSVIPEPKRVEAE